MARIFIQEADGVSDWADGHLLLPLVVKARAV